MSRRSDDSPPLVRPYALTRGRTRPSRDYPIEALVTAAPGVVADAGRSPEERAMIDLCLDTSQSVAEIAARVGVPLGVVRVLLADLADRGLVQVHTHVTTARPDARLLERVLGGLRSL